MSLKRVRRFVKIVLLSKEQHRLSSQSGRRQIHAIPGVAASERGTAQTVRIYTYGVVGRLCHLVEQSYQRYI